jgi:hypothetical protein
LPTIDPCYHFAINVPRGSIRDAAAWIAERRELLVFHDDPHEDEGGTIAHTDQGASALYFLDAGGYASAASTRWRSGSTASTDS